MEKSGGEKMMFGNKLREMVWEKLKND